MAEKSNTSRKPQSLNDSHYRLLQELSAPPKPTFKTSSEEEDEEEMGDDRNPTKVKIEGRRRLCKAASKENSHTDLSLPHFSFITDFDSSPEQEKPIKVKIEGRRRLCKLSSRDGNGNTEERAVVHEDKSSYITDFNSPPAPTRNLNKGDDDNGGGNEIRDILDNLSSKLELLSIEKRRDMKKADPEGNSSTLVKSKEIDQQKVEFPEYASAESSFSFASESSDPSLDVTKNAGGSIQCVVDDCEEDSESVDVKFGKDESRQVGEKLLSVGHTFVSRTEGGGGGGDVDDEDDCKVLNRKKFVKKVGRQDSKLKKYYDLGEVDVLDNFTEDSVLEDEKTITLSGLKYTYKLPGDIATMLYPHQRDGIRWLWSLHCQGKGGILGDDMGLGKTMQICGFLAGLFHSRLIKRALIVAPKTLLDHWLKELSAVGLSEKTREYFGTSAKLRQYELQYILQDKGILLTTYDIVRNNSKSLRGDYYFDDDKNEDGVTWDYMILDEGHLIKNPSTQRAKSLLEIPSAHRIIISGTPIQNNLKELWALFNFCCPDLLGDKQWFKENFENAILRGNEKKASDRDKRIGSEAAKGLRERIKPYFLRRLKNEVFTEDADDKNPKLSKKSEIIVWLRLTSCQRKLYEAFLKSELVLSAFDGSPLAALTILKKICDHPLLLTKRAAEDVLEGMDSMLQQEDVYVAERLAMHIADVAEKDELEENHETVSCKISFIMSLLDDLIPKGHSILIFSQTRKMLNLIQDSIVSNAYEFLRIDGTTKASDRLKIVNDFQDGIGASIFLLTSQVGGLGLTLTRADRVIVVDPAWNPSTDNQSVDRAYRIGQTKDVLVYRLMTSGTVEEKIYRKQVFKGGLFKTATEQKEQIRYFSQQDLRDLFSIPAQGFDVSLTQQQLYEEHDCQYLMDESLKSHIKFLQSLGIAGVSHHSLLFSKTAPVHVQDDEEVIRKPRATFYGTSSSYAVEQSVNGAEYAFKPKDVKSEKKVTSPDSVGKLTESEIKERINRLSITLANKAMVSRLPDKGVKIQKQIEELNAELYRTKMAKENKVIDLDDITGEIERVLKV
ncbi:protein CHROMATIN REMODELING 24 [Ziziphus jujuba]|uniref:Protein CHROMATIN REMODELING 24 n=1 Tax=Ziziphus jujuba TaxID=326968 RepID=A0A6P4AYL7_ZIZJJ|nr:protein CHROMATIN REMODELING 24 [Ziziphus jujuba]